MARAAPAAARMIEPVVAQPANAFATKSPAPVAKAPVVNPFAMAPKPKPSPVANAFKGFAAGVLGNERMGQIDQMHAAKADERTKKTLALMQQQRALPAEQRGQWWMQNAPVISEIIGRDISQMPLDEAQFSDQALDGHIAALSAQMGIGPTMPEPPRYQGMGLGDGGIGVLNQSTGSLEVVREPTQKPIEPKASDYVETTLADGVYFVNKNDPNDKIRLGPAPKKPGEGPVDPNAPMDPERIRLEREYAKSWDGIRNNYSDVRGQYERLKSMGSLAANDPASRSAADLALIVSFTKMLDPGSVAREGEVALTQSAASLYDMVRNLPNQWVNGQTTIPDATRRALLKAADEMMPSYDAAYERLATDYARTADAYGYGRDRVMMGYRPPAPPPPPPPNFLDAAGQFVGNVFSGMGGQQRQPPMRPSAPQSRQSPPVDDVTDLLEKYR